jgi:AcrR family transcriptional regulator
MEEIAAAAGLTRQTVYAHYPSRQRLLAAIVDRLTVDVVEALGAVDIDTGSATDALRRWLEESWRLLRRYPVLLNPAIATGDGADGYEQHLPIMETLLRVLDRGRRCGEFDVTHPVSWCAAAILALGHAAGQEIIGGRLDVEAAGAAFRDAALRVV